MFSEFPTGQEGCYQWICDGSWSVWECMVSKESCDVYMIVEMAVLLGCLLDNHWRHNFLQLTVIFCVTVLAFQVRYASNMACNCSTLTNRIPVNRAPRSLKQKKRMMEMMRRPRMLAT